MIIYINNYDVCMETLPTPIFMQLLLLLLLLKGWYKMRKCENDNV